MPGRKTVDNQLSSKDIDIKSLVDSSIRSIKIQEKTADKTIDIQKNIFDVQKEAADSTYKMQKKMFDNTTSYHEEVFKIGVDTLKDSSEKIVDSLSTNAKDVLGSGLSGMWDLSKNVGKSLYSGFKKFKDVKEKIESQKSEKFLESINKGQTELNKHALKKGSIYTHDTHVENVLVDAEKLSLVQTNKITEIEKTLFESKNIASDMKRLYKKSVDILLNRNKIDASERENGLDSISLLINSQDILVDIAKNIYIMRKNTDANLGIVRAYFQPTVDLWRTYVRNVEGDSARTENRLIEIRDMLSIIHGFDKETVRVNDSKWRWYFSIIPKMIGMMLFSLPKSLALHISGYDKKNRIRGFTASEKTNILLSGIFDLLKPILDNSYQLNSLILSISDYSEEIKTKIYTTGEKTNILLLGIFDLLKPLLNNSYQLNSIGDYYEGRAKADARNITPKKKQNDIIDLVGSIVGGLTSGVGVGVGGGVGVAAGLTVKDILKNALWYILNPLKWPKLGIATMIALMVYQGIQGWLEGENLSDKAMLFGTGILGVPVKVAEWATNSVLSLFGSEWRVEYNKDMIYKDFQRMNDWIFENITIPTCNFFSFSWLSNELNFWKSNLSNFGKWIGESFDKFMKKFEETIYNPIVKFFNTDSDGWLSKQVEKLKKEHPLFAESLGILKNITYDTPKKFWGPKIKSVAKDTTEYWGEFFTNVSNTTVDFWGNYLGKEADGFKKEMLVLGKDIKKVWWEDPINYWSEYLTSPFGIRFYKLTDRLTEDEFLTPAKPLFERVAKNVTGKFDKLGDWMVDSFYQNTISSKMYGQEFIYDVDDFSKGVTDYTINAAKSLQKSTTETFSDTSKMAEKYYGDARQFYNVSKDKTVEYYNRGIDFYYKVKNKAIEYYDKGINFYTFAEKSIRKILDDISDFIFVGRMEANKAYYNTGTNKLVDDVKKGVVRGYDKTLKIGKDTLGYAGNLLKVAKDKSDELVKSGYLQVVSMTKKSEGEEGASTVGKVDKGGNYGSYQFTGKTLEAFLEKYGLTKEFENLAKGTREFGEKWKKVVTDIGKNVFETVEDVFMKETHWDPFLKSMSSIGLEVKDQALSVQKYLMSLVNVHGVEGGTNLIKKALGDKKPQNLNIESILQLIHTERSRVKDSGLEWFTKIKDSDIPGVVERQRRELQEALKGLKNIGTAKKSPARVEMAMSDVNKAEKEAYEKREAEKAKDNMRADDMNRHLAANTLNTGKLKDEVATSNNINNIMAVAVAGGGGRGSGINAGSGPITEMDNVLLSLSLAGLLA